MALQQRLSLSPRMSQRLVLTPAMQQAIKLLPLTTLELADVINQEMVENPLLEEIPEDELSGPAPETRAAEQAVSALVNLQYSQGEAFGAVNRAVQKLGAEAPVDALIKAALKELAS